ncbi:MAG: TetR/AcrR family transcriptional regulator [Magnetovibrio sp.]|nr:TetR/AcrR family transcriptional regulator [Magnetovibrio sp.]
MKINSVKKPADERVLHSALILFSNKGFFNTSVHDISRESGVSIGSIYHHFKDKQGIAQAMYVSLVENLHGQIDQIEARHHSAHDRCRAVIEMLFEMTERQPELMSFMLYAKHREFLPDEKPMCSSLPFERMRNFTMQGMKNGEIRIMDPLVCAACLYGGAVRLIHLKLDGIVDKPLGKCLHDVWACAWRGVAT